MGIIKYNGISTDEVGIVVETPPNYEIPERNYEIIPVPGRNGDIIIDLNSYKNVVREYDIAIGEEDGDFSVLSSKIANWLYSGHGYLRLEDSYLPEYYMMAAVIAPNNIINILQQAGRATVQFNRKPQRFLKSGDRPIIVTKQTTLFNPTQFNSKPLIIVNGTGSGVVNIGGYSVKIDNLEDEITIDCELEESYKGTNNQNKKVTLSNGYPLLVPRDNIVNFSGEITKVTIIPRWWTI